jgi:tetratricopeptide (TPR) repeat protein
VWGEGLLHVGRLAEARRIADQALELSRTQGEAGCEAAVLVLLGDIAMVQDPPDVGGAIGAYAEALTLGHRLGMRPLIAHCHLGLGKLYLRTGKRHEAQEHLTMATTMYREMNMRFWLEQAEVELKEAAA